MSLRARVNSFEFFFNPNQPNRRRRVLCRVRYSLSPQGPPSLLHLHYKRGLLFLLRLFPTNQPNPTRVLRISPLSPPLLPFWPCRLPAGGGGGGGDGNDTQWEESKKKRKKKHLTEIVRKFWMYTVMTRLTKFDLIWPFLKEMPHFAFKMRHSSLSLSLSLSFLLFPSRKRREKK